MELKNNSGLWYISAISKNPIVLRVNNSGIYTYFLLIASCLSLVLNIIVMESCQGQPIVNYDDDSSVMDEVSLPKKSENSNLIISVPTPGLSTALEGNIQENVPDSDLSFSDRLIEVKNIEVSGNTLFAVEIAELTEQFKGKSATLSQLYELRSSISQLYADHGYVNSGAYLPPQKIQDGIIKIEVLEGGIETIEVSGNKHLDTRYITSRLTSLPSPIQTEQLLERLQLLRLDPLIENISAELSAGLTPGMSRLDIEVQEADSFTLSSSLDNHKSPSIGSNSRSLGMSHGNLLGFGDRLSLNYTNTEGSNGLDVGYAFPINSNQGTISFAYGFNSNDIVENPFTPLDIETKSDYYELSFRQPIINKPNQEVALGVSFSRQHSESSLLNIPFPLSIGADNSGNTNISALRFFQEYTERSDNSVFALRSQFSVGVDLFDATINNNAPDSSFFAWRGQSQWVRQLNDDFLFLVRGDIQFADNLVPLEQFRLGGATSVRGYRQDVSLSDSGLFASAELRVPVLRINKLDGVVQLVPFFDLGFPWSGENEVVDVDSLLSIGMGLNFNVGTNFNARLDYGIPLTDIKTEGDSLQEDGVTFSLGYSF